MLGLDGAGKTTALYAAKGSEPAGGTMPTVGFNCEEVRVGRKALTVWDVGGQDKLRPLWRHYFAGAGALVWVVDSSDAERLQLSRDELHVVLHDLERPLPLLVLWNKQDVPHAASEHAAAALLALSEVPRFRVQAVQANAGLGLKEGFAWLARQL